MKHHTVTAAFQAPREEVFAYLADIERLPEWATEFARELKRVNGRHKAVNGLGEFFFELHADAGTGVIDMLAGPEPENLLLPNTRRRHPNRRQRLHLHDVPSPGPTRRAVREPARLATARVRKSRTALQ
jgi:hypothetical protein